MTWILCCLSLSGAQTPWDSLSGTLAPLLFWEHTSLGLECASSRDLQDLPPPPTGLCLNVTLSRSPSLSMAYWTALSRTSFSATPACMVVPVVPDRWAAWSRRQARTEGTSCSADQALSSSSVISQSRRTPYTFFFTKMGKLFKISESYQ